MVSRTAVFIGALFAAPFTVDSGQPDRPQVTGIFSDMRASRGSGDVSGIEIFVLVGKGGYYALVQIAEGSPSAPVLVRATVRDDALTFELPPPYKGQTFTGRVTRYGLEGTLGVDRVVLPRSKSYWQ